MQIQLKKFPTHVEYTDNKVAPNKLIKVNNQSIYNGRLNRFARNIAVTNLHEWVISQIPNPIPVRKYPVTINYTFRLVKNHGSIMCRNGKIFWKPVKPSYEPNWDIQNVAHLWMKVTDDALVKAGVLADDDVRYVKGESYHYEWVDNLDKREIIVKFIS